jgi:hypothetical protein
MVSVTLAAIFAVLSADPQPKVHAEAPTANSLQQAVERGVEFLVQDAKKWRSDHECATCHHGTLTVWALNEARRRRITVKEEDLKEIGAWTKTRFLEGIEKPRDSRPGWNLVKVAAIYLACMAELMPEREILSREELQQMTDHVARHQEAEGFWSTPPPANGPPPVFESSEVITLWACLALGRPDAMPAELESRERGMRWLNSIEPGKELQSAMLRLLVDVRAGKPQEAIDAQVKKILDRQQPDGGWGQIPGAASDAFATGQALFALNLAGVKPERTEIQRAIAFLIASQKQDGSWPMTSRAQPGEKPFTNPVPITYFGSAWATIGLLRSLR